MPETMPAGHDIEPTVRLIVALLHDNAARDFLDSGVLDGLARRFQLSFVTSDRLTPDLSSFGPTIGRYQISRARLTIYFLGAGLWHMAVKRRFELNRTNTLRLATFGMSARLERTIAALSLVGLARPASLLMRALLRASAPDLIPANCHADAVLVYTSVRSHFADDVVRAARRRRIPTLAVTNNWDNLNTKAFFERPAFLGVWGEQAFLIARLMHQFLPEQLFVVGAPRFDIYRRQQPSRSAAQAELGLPADRRVLLFCGAGVPFEEVSLLDDFDAAVSDGRLPDDLLLVYKPHPLRFARAAERPFEEGRYRHVTLAREPTSYTDLSHYPKLLASADAVISPFSSMVMEGAHLGRPALCLGYNDPGHANHDWNRAGFNLHNFVIRHGEGDWVVLCESRDQFIDRCRDLLALIGDANAARSAEGAASMVWVTGRSDVAARITAALRTILGGDRAPARAVRPAPLVESSEQAFALSKES